MCRAGAVSAKLCAGRGLGRGTCGESDGTRGGPVSAGRRWGGHGPEGGCGWGGISDSKMAWLGEGGRDEESGG